MEISDVVVKVHPQLTGLDDPWRYETLSKIVDGLKSAGLTVIGLEGDPFDMSPIKQYGERGCSSDWYLEKQVNVTNSVILTTIL